ncbi:MAG: hypothetical protein R3C68_15560 [Myxococcota bacterium]
MRVVLLIVLLGGFACAHTWVNDPSCRAMVDHCLGKCSGGNLLPKVDTASNDSRTDCQRNCYEQCRSSQTKD